MSSVLKALRNQQSPLLKAHSQVALESAGKPASAIGLIVTLLVSLVVAAGIGWLGVQYWLSNNAVEVAEPIPQASYQLGTIAAVIEPQWPESEPATAEQIIAMEPSDTITSSAQRQAENSVINDDKTIDLNQVSPELLSAFESALNESGEGRSVVPTLANLSQDFQRTVPSFSYDGHQYSSRAQARWVELGGVRLFEGERWQGLTVLTIAPAHVVLSRNNQAFQQPALEDWTKP
ncbi:general secretion pathway protein GspB [Pseudidiomarina gelatinasegens]|uniref:general secretion pathway protein GspB n=1 Tax=Pseudidiomarina gelatinasegens TaxID=2487740 RepID=UPI0030ED2B6A